MRSRSIGVAAFCAAALVLAAYGVYRYYQRGVNAKPPTNVIKTVTVPPGYTTRDVAELLEREGLILDAKFFVWYCRRHNLDGKLQAGRYELESDAGIAGIARELAAGHIAVIRVTIPEGYTITKTAAAMEAAGMCTAEQFLEACRRGDPRGRVTGTNLEGYLFPDTYEFARDADARDAVRAMVDRFFEVIGPEQQRRAQDLGYELSEIVTLASIIEREARRDDERPLVASVFYNRLRTGMKLESCATVIYALGRQPDRLTVQDLKVDSPYNTYRYPGLPPGPICSPGRASLMAALYPASTDYLFFVSNGDGSHTFSRRFGDHVAAREAKKRKKVSR